MAVLGVGNEGDSFESGFTSASGQTSCKDALARGGPRAVNAAGHQVKLSSAVSDCWVHGWWAGDSTGTSASQAVFALVDSGTSTLVFRILAVDSYTTSNKPLKAQYWNGSAYVDIASFSAPFFEASSSGFEFDLQFKAGASGRFRFFVNRQLVIDMSGSYVTSPTTWDRVRVATPDATGYSWGSIIVADESTVGWRLDSLIPNVNATGSGWTGATVTNLADTSVAPAYNSATLATTNAAGSTFLSAYENPATFATIRDAKGVSIATCGILQAGSGFTNLSLYVNSVTLGNMGFGTSFTSYQQFLATDPATSAAWTNTSISNMTAGAITS